MPKNMAQLKRYFSSGGGVVLTVYGLLEENGKFHPQPHKYLHKGRKPIKVQTNAVQLEGGSWWEYPPTKRLTFDDRGFTVKYPPISDGASLYMRYDFTGDQPLLVA